MLVASQNQLFSWGDNQFQQLGLGQKFEKVKMVETPQQITEIPLDNKSVISISCSKGEKHQHTGCVLDDGTAYMWGDPYKG